MPTLLNELLEAGVFSGERIPEELQSVLDEIVETGFLKEPPRDGNVLMIQTSGTDFHVWDRKGYFARAKTIEGLVILLMMSENKTGARGTLWPHNDPGEKILEPARPDLEALRRRAAAMRAGAEAKIGSIAGQPGSGEMDTMGETDNRPIRTMGLGDGIPRIET